MRALAAAALALVAVEGRALTCLPPDPLQSFRAAAESPARYTVVLGRLDFDSDWTPPDAALMQQAEAPVTIPPIPARFTGYGLSSGGFDIPLSREVLIRPLCYGPWCAGLPGRGDILAFVRIEEDLLVFEVDPCGQWILPPPDTATERALAACMAGADCGG